MSTHSRAAHLQTRHPDHPAPTTRTSNMSNLRGTEDAVARALVGMRIVDYSAHHNLTKNQVGIFITKALCTRHKPQVAVFAA